MKPENFIDLELNNLTANLKDQTFKYKYFKSIESHVIFNENFRDFNNSTFLDLEISFRRKFKEKYPYELLTFINNELIFDMSNSTSYQNVDYVNELLQYFEPIFNDNDVFIINIIPNVSHKYSPSSIVKNYEIEKFSEDKSQIENYELLAA